MDMNNLSKTQKLTMSGAVMAIYIVVMYFTQSFAFGQYQVRIATAIYGAAYLFPFLVVPLGLSNLIANMLMGGLGVFDIVGGGLIGLLTAGACALLGKKKLSPWLTAVPITLIPALGVSLWLSKLLGVPYWVLAVSLLVGQAIAGVVGALLCKPIFALMREKSDATRGFSVGLAAHGLGTSAAFQINRDTGAFSGLAMGLNGLFTAFAAPILLPLLLQLFE